VYSIGQVLFVVLNKKSQIYPMQVIEIITKKTLQGEEIQYLLQGGSDKTSTVLLNQVDGEIFDESEKARSILVQRATSQINRLVDAAVTKSKEWYGVSAIDSSPHSIQDLPDLNARTPEFSRKIQDDEGVVGITLPDGTVAKVRLPSM
jgi:hypothetical protein